MTNEEFDGLQTQLTKAVFGQWSEISARVRTQILDPNLRRHLYTLLWLMIGRNQPLQQSRDMLMAFEPLVAYLLGHCNTLPDTVATVRMMGVEEPKP